MMGLQLQSVASAMCKFSLFVCYIVVIFVAKVINYKEHYFKLFKN